MVIEGCVAMKVNMSYNFHNAPLLSRLRLRGSFTFFAAGVAVACVRVVAGYLDRNKHGRGCRHG